MPQSSNVAQESEAEGLLVSLHVRVPAGLLKRTRFEAVDAETSVQSIVEKALEEHLAKRKRKG